MGLAFLIVVMKALGLREDGGDWNDAARFWITIFGLNFAEPRYVYRMMRAFRATSREEMIR